jgi:hypothetical protein
MIEMRTTFQRVLGDEYQLTWMRAPFMPWVLVAMIRAGTSK